MAKAKTSAVAQPINDVAKPNDTPPAENSKSVIITKRPLMRDPMMAALASDVPVDPSAEPSDTETSPAPEPVKAGPLSVTHQLVITPPSHDEPTAPAVIGTPTVAQPISDVIKPAEEVATSLPDTEPIPAAAEAAPETAAVAGPADVKLDPLNQEAAEAQAQDEAAKRKAELTALVISQTYFLPVDGVELKRARYFTVLGVLLIVGLALAWADAALDAGLVAVNGVPHTSFFQQTKIANTDPHDAVPATQTYNAPLSKYSLRLPAAWKLDISKSTATADSLSAGPVTSSASVGTSSISFSSGPSLPATDVNATVDSVLYQKLARTAGAPTYLQELVYHTDTSHYGVSASVVNDNTLKNGAIVKNLTPTFYTSNANSPSQLVTVTKRSTDFSSLGAAIKYTQLNTYQQARSVLLSLSSPKQ